MEIKITRYAAAAPKVTGAALRSVQAADQRADEVFASLFAAAERLSEAANVQDPAAIDIAIAIEANERFEAQRKAISSLVKRHQQSAISDWGNWEIGNRAQHVRAAIYAAAEHLFDTLRDAGVPISVKGIFTAEYWREAAARGC